MGTTQPTPFEWARELLANPQLAVVVDTETTGVGYDDEIIELAVVAIDRRVVLDTLVSLSRRTSVPEAATAIHGITTEDLSGQPKYGALKGEIASTFEGKRILAYNAAFDYRMMLRAAELDGGYRPRWSQWECVMEKYAAYRACRGLTAKRRYHRLGGKHRAVEDAMKVIDLVHEMATRNGS